MAKKSGSCNKPMGKEMKGSHMMPEMHKGMTSKSATRKLMKGMR